MQPYRHPPPHLQAPTPIHSHTPYTHTPASIDTRTLCVPLYTLLYTPTDPYRHAHTPI